MFNRYFKTHNNIDFMYANMILQNIYFAQISLNYILNFNNFNIDVFHSEHTFYFYYIQNLLTACGNISNIFYNYGGYAGKEATERSKRLRTIFNVHKKNYPLLFQKEVRNTFIHFDERYEEFNGNLGDYNLIDENTDPFMRAVIITNPHLRTYDKTTGIYHTFDRKQNRIQYNLYDLNQELTDLLAKIKIHPLLDSAWTD